MKNQPKSEPSQLFQSISKVQIDAFYLNLLGYSDQEILEKMHKSDIQGVENITVKTISAMIEAESALYYLTSIAQPETKPILRRT